MDTLLAFIVKVCKVGCGKILLLLMVKVILLALLSNAVDHCLCVLVNLGVSSIGALDHIGSIVKDRPRVGPATSVAAKGALSASSTCGVGTFIPSAILGKRPLGLADTDLGLKCSAWGSAHGFTPNGPDIGILSFGFHRGLHHCFQSLALMGGGESLQNAIIGEVTAKPWDKPRVESVNEYLADTDGKGILVNKWTRSAQVLRVVIQNRLEDGVALHFLIRLTDVVKGGMGLLGVAWAELIEEAFKDGWGCMHDDFGANLRDQGSAIHPCRSKVERG
jgi:hypothetical protein